MKRSKGRGEQCAHAAAHIAFHLEHTPCFLALMLLQPTSTAELALIRQLMDPKPFVIPLITCRTDDGSPFGPR
jgi:hypothetical protein